MTDAILSLSGGQDSTTCLSWAKSNFNDVYAISFDYGQKHKIELDCAKKICEIADVKDHFIIKIDELFNEISITDNAMINPEKNVNDQHKMFKNLPATFVPFRNLFLLSIAAAKGLDYGINNIVTGICQTDFSGYPDCRNSFKESLQETLSLAIDYSVIIHTPLMYLTKAQTVKYMEKMGNLNWYKYTHTCYNGQKPPCLECPACKLRQKGFEEAELKDPLFD